MFGSSSAIRMRFAMPFPSCRLGHGLDVERSSGAWQLENEHRSAAGRALGAKRAAEMLDDLPAYRKPKPRALRLAGERVTGLPELLEDHLPILGTHPRAVVDHGNARAAAADAELDGHTARALPRELRRNRQEADQHP